LAAKLFIELPRLQIVKLAAYTHRKSGDEYVLECTVTREAMTMVAVSAPEKLADLISCLVEMQAVYELDADSGLKAIGKPAWTEKLPQ